MRYFVEVENNLLRTRGDLLVRRKSNEGTLEERWIKCPAYEPGSGGEKSRKLSFSLEGKKDYLEIKVDNKEDELGPCRIDIQSNRSVTFIPPAVASVTVIPSEDSKTKALLRIPSGPPKWELEIMMASEPGSLERYPESLSIPEEGSQTNVTVGDEPPAG